MAFKISVDLEKKNNKNYLLCHLKYLNTLLQTSNEKRLGGGGEKNKKNGVGRV